MSKEKDKFFDTRQKCDICKKKKKMDLMWSVRICKACRKRLGPSPIDWNQ